MWNGTGKCITWGVLGSQEEEVARRCQRKRYLHGMHTRMEGHLERGRQIHHGNDVMQFWPVATCFRGQSLLYYGEACPPAISASQPALEHTSEYYIPVIRYTVQIAIQIVALPLLGK